MGTLPMTADARARTPARPGRRPAAFALAALTIAALAPTASRGAPITSTTPASTASIPLTTTDWLPGTPAAVTNPLSVPKFDPSLGKLMAVNIALGYTVQNDFSMNFIAPSTITVTAEQ